MMFKAVVIVLFLAIVISLFSGLFFLVKDRGEGQRTLRSLALRVGLSAFLLMILVLGALMGWIRPHAVGGHHENVVAPSVSE